MNAATGHTDAMARPRMSTWDAARLKALLAERGWSQADLAAMVGVPLNAVRGWIHKSAPSPQTFPRIAAALGVATTDLAPLSDAPTLAELRWHAGYTAANFASAVGLSPSLVGDQLRGDTPISRPDRWCELLGVDLDLLWAAWDNSREQRRRRASE